MKVSPSLEIKQTTFFGFLCLGLFCLGLITLVVTVYNTHRTAQQVAEQSKLNQEIYQKRQEAMAQAKSEGRHEYSFSIEKAPLAVTP